jgi:hypothetical protein
MATVRGIVDEPPLPFHPLYTHCVEQKYRLSSHLPKQRLLRIFETTTYGFIACDGDQEEM